MGQEFNIGAMKAEAIAKSFGVDLEKGRVGVYEDNAENRRLNRVGQPYGHKKEEEAPKGRQAAQPDQSQGKQGAAAATSMAEHAAAASDEALKRAAADPKAAPEVKQAAQAEIEKRSDDSGKSKITKESLQECSTDVRDTQWGKYYSIQPQVIRASGGNFDRSDKNDDKKEYLSLDIVGDKKQVLKDIESLNKKLGLNLDISKFERIPKDRYNPNYYSIYYNPETGTWGSHDEIWEELRTYYTKDAAENEKKEKEKNKKRLADAINGDSFTSKQLSEIFKNDSGVREAAFMYFNYEPEWAEEGGATKEQMAFCKKLAKLGASIAPKTFDAQEQEEAEAYESKMREKGYELFDVYDGDTYMWLVVKSNKLKQ